MAKGDLPSAFLTPTILNRVKPSPSPHFPMGIAALGNEISCLNTETRFQEMGWNCLFWSFESESVCSWCYYELLFCNIVTHLLLIFIFSWIHLPILVPIVHGSPGQLLGSDNSRSHTVLEKIKKKARKRLETVPPQFITGRHKAKSCLGWWKGKAVWRVKNSNKAFKKKKKVERGRNGVGRLVYSNPWWEWKEAIKVLREGQVQTGAAKADPS